MFPKMKQLQLCQGFAIEKVKKTFSLLGCLLRQHVASELKVERG
jgi:hypothetical protein